jgi:hypothetical protein
LVLGACFFLFYFMAGDDEDAMSGEMAGLGLAGREGEVSAPPAGAPSVIITATAILIDARGNADGYIYGGESIAAVPAPLLVAQTAREVITAAQKFVVDFVEDNGREPLKSELFLCWSSNCWVPLVVT